MSETINYGNDFKIKNTICEIGKRMYWRGYVASNDGNISVKCGENAVWVTPTGVSKGYMDPSMLVKVDMEGNILAGTHKPSSELKMHLRVFKENPSVQSVMHAHPAVSTSYAAAGIPLDRPIVSEAIVLLGTIPVAPYAVPGTYEVPDSIAPYCKDYNGVLLGNHGALTWGKDPYEAYYRLETLEHYATMMMYTDNIIKKSSDLTCNQVTELIKIRNSLGITGGGLPGSCSAEPSNSAPSVADSGKSDMIQSIVSMVTNEILKKYDIKKR